MLALICSAVLLATARATIIVYTTDIPHTIVEEFRDIQASFGPDLPLEGLRGLVVPGEPKDGCGPLAKPPTTENHTGRWIVLVARYSCSFEDKVRNAQAAGYDGAIVHNVNSSDLEPMSAKNPEGIEIPSVFVSELAGEKLAEFYNYTSDFYIMVTDDSPFDINTHLLLPFAVVVVLCLLVILIFMIVKCIKDRRRARRHRLPNRSLKQIPTCKFSKGGPYETCAICLDDYLEGEVLRVLPCAHAYHAVCIDPWLTQNRRVCPVCKRKVFTAGESRRQANSDSDSDAEPLLRAAPTTRGGGTFDEPTENPLRRSDRLWAVGILRSLFREPEEESQADEETQTNETGSAPTQPSDRSPLLPARRARRPRRARSARPAARTHSATEHSINTDAEPTLPAIGVAALPVAPDTDTHVVNL